MHDIIHESLSRQEKALCLLRLLRRLLRRLPGGRLRRRHRLGGVVPQRLGDDVLADAEVVGRDVRLTEEGGRLAEATLDKHRFFERLLVETASAEACRMEHCLSEDSYRRFAAYLGSRRDEGDGG
mgnify:CR=1 FL=1